MPSFAFDPHEAQRLFQAGYAQGIHVGFEHGKNLALDPDTRLQQWFPKLKPGAYRIIGSAHARYNCIAWAVGKRDAHWWPGQAPHSYWPSGIPTNSTLDAFVQLFRSIGYEACTDPRFERRYEQVAIFVKGQHVTHAARQLGNGKWSSKLGQWELIEHDLEALTGSSPTEYGDFQQIMRRNKGLVRMMR